MEAFVRNVSPTSILFSLYIFPPSKSTSSYFYQLQIVFFRSQIDSISRMTMTNLALWFKSKSPAKNIVFDKLVEMMLNKQ
jgi:hypothetical protein